MANQGRRYKYLFFIELLERDLIYSPATVVRLGELNGFFNGYDKEALPDMRRKVRHTLARLSTNRGFPYEGDGWVEIKGQAPLRGWYGWRWREAVDCGDNNQVEG